MNNIFMRKKPPLWLICLYPFILVNIIALARLGNDIRTTEKCCTEQQLEFRYHIPSICQLIICAPNSMNLHLVCYLEQLPETLDGGNIIPLASNDHNHVTDFITTNKTWLYLNKNENKYLL